MKQKAYTIDNASLLFLSLMQKNHTNAFRFTMTLTEEVCPETLQAAVDRVYRRFPTIIARFRAGFFHYLQILLLKHLLMHLHYFLLLLVKIA